MKIAHHTFIRGQTWAPERGRELNVVNAAEARRVLAGDTGRLCQPYWILDYTFTPGSPTCIGPRGRHWIERPAHMAHLYAPRAVYRENAGKEPRLVHSCWLMFTAGKAAHLEKLVGPRDGFARYSDPEQRLARELKPMCDEGIHGEQAYWRVQAVLCATVHLLKTAMRVNDGEYRIAPVTSQTAESGLVNAVRSYLQSHVGERIEVGRIAREAHVSVSTLTHRYRQETGLTPMQTLLGMRVELVKSLLLKGHTLKYIAGETGFCDEYHLYKAFKNHQGVSPRQFLKEMQG